MSALNSLILHAPWPWFLRGVVNDSIQATVKERRNVPFEAEMDLHGHQYGMGYMQRMMSHQQIERLETGVEIRAARYGSASHRAASNH